MKETPETTRFPGIPLAGVSILLPIASVVVGYLGTFTFDWFDFMAGPSASQLGAFALVFIIGGISGIAGSIRGSWLLGGIGVLLNSLMLWKTLYWLLHPVVW